MGYFRYVKKYTVIINEEWLDDLISKSDSEDMSDGTETKTSDVSLSSSSSSNDNIENENANQSCFLNLVDNSKTLQNKGPRNFDNVEYWYGGNSGREWFWPCKNEEEFDKSLVSLKQLVRVLHQVKEGTAMVLQGNQITPENLLKFNKECSNLFDDLVVQQRIRTNVINFMRKGRGLIGFSGNCTDQDVENFFNSLLPSFLGISSDNVILETGNDAENKTTAGNFGELPLKILFKKCPGVTNQSVVFLTKKFKNVKKIFVKSCPNLTGEFIQEWTEK
jgi:hypothetical protein